MRELTLKEIQDGSFEVLKKIKRICEEQKLTYYIAYGTLLGAVRHKGYIPWDDDVDICMPREDYEKFVSYCIDNAESIKPFEIKHYRNCPNYVYTIARLSDSRYKIDYMNTRDYGLGLFVDIYPLDGIDVNDVQYIKKLNKNIRRIMQNSADKFIPSKNFLKTIIKVPFYLLYQKNFNLIEHIRKQDEFSQKYDYDDCDDIQCTCWDTSLPIDTPFKKEWFGNGETYLEINGEKFRAPENYDMILKTIYGDYMQLPPKEKRIGHHFYSAYKKEEYEGGKQ